ncbi:MAG: penicillin-binding protein 2 [Bdellovibrionales bacterium CG10_big_fil_rev_8_21_14_0_10_45_34]|nr:MAG: penicillin-binding protein 2 [Bdellovibrionales bacterium CG10_big_fil_rev_8_21_14_0_10_45_34]
MSDYLNDPEEVKEYYPRFKFMYFVLAATSILFFSRLWYLQIIKGTELRVFSEKNRIKEVKNPAPRGMILDRDGNVLVDNHPGFSATITPQYATKLEETAQAIAPILGISAETIVSDVKKSRRQNGTFKPVAIKENLERDEVARIERLRLDHPGLAIDMSIKRTYLLRENGAQLFGYVAEIDRDELQKVNEHLIESDQLRQGDLIGKSGIEKFYDRELRGKDGFSFVQVDAHGREVASEGPNFITSFSQTVEATPGQTLRLTVDKDIQEATYKAFRDLERIGAAVALDPNNGEVLAWVNQPSFDPNGFSTGFDPKTWRGLVFDTLKPLRNKVIQDHYPPGSTFKALVALAGLEEKVINEHTTHFCPGYLSFGRRRYACHSKHGHGRVNLLQALERSCNVFFYKVGIELGIDRIAKYAKAFGIGRRTGIRLFNEENGLMPTEAWKRNAYGEEWQPGENLSNAIGQGFVLTTPLQLAVAVGGVATSGLIYRPLLLKQMIASDGQVVKEIGPELVANLQTGEAEQLTISPKSFKLVLEGLKAVVNGSHGTGRRSQFSKEFLAAGKSGTAQLFTLSKDQVYATCSEKPFNQRHHGWFVAYAPAEKPLIVTAVLALHSCSGGGGAAPIAREILYSYFKKHYPRILNEKNLKMGVRPASISEPEPLTRTNEPGLDLQNGD